MRVSKRILIYVLCISLLGSLSLGLFPLTASAAPRTPQELSDEISQEVNSPFCPGRLLRDCPSSKAGELRDSITQRLIAGETKDSIVKSLLQQYGDEINPFPKKDALGLFGWIAPFVFLLIGALLVVRFVAKSMQKKPVE